MKVVTERKRRGGDAAMRFSRFPRPQAENRAELIGSDECTAAGLTINGRAPVLALCRQLIADGHDPGLPLEVWRGPVLCLRVRSIGEAAQLRVATHGGGFVDARLDAQRPRSCGKPQYALSLFPAGQNAPARLLCHERRSSPSERQSRRARDRNGVRSAIND